MTDVVSSSTVSFTVNGTAVSVSGDHPHLLSALRDELNITSAKDGCSPSGQCGCCTVMIDGKAVAAKVREEVRTRVEALRAAAPGVGAAGSRVMPCLLDAVRARATVGEISDTFEAVYGRYRAS